MSNNYKIISGLEIPNSSRAGGRPKVYPVEQLQIGQCFKFPANLRSKVSASAGRYAKTSGKRFVIRVLPDEPGMAACWRVEPKAKAEAVTQ
jgi:hypothetical protein